MRIVCALLLFVSCTMAEATTPFQRFASRCGVAVEPGKEDSNAQYFIKLEDGAAWRTATFREIASAEDWKEMAFAWLVGGKVRLVGFRIASQSGDWHHNINYCYRSDGSLHRLMASFNVAGVGKSIKRTQEYTAEGKLTKNERKVEEGEGVQVIDSSRALEDYEELEQKLPVFGSAEKLPFFSLIGGRQR